MEAMQEIKGLEIFRAGDYGELGKFSENDLDEMAAEYSADKHKAPFTLGHVEDDSKPALGWIKKLYRKGISLFADGEIVSELVDWVKKGFYENVSAAIYKDFAGVLGKKYLRHVAVLGAVPPIVKGMAGLKAAMFSDTENGEFLKVSIGNLKQEAIMPEKNEVTFSETQHEKILAGELLKKENELTLKFSEIQKTSEAKITTLEAKLKAAEDKVIEFAEKATSADVEKFVDGLIQAKKTTPALKDGTVAMLKKAAKLDTVLFSEMKANLEAALPVIEFGEIDAAKGEGEKNVKFSEADAKLGITKETVEKYGAKGYTYHLGTGN